jgi:hypothetical protein
MHTRSVLLLLLLFALGPAAAGCDFFVAPEPEPPDPNLDGVLACGDDEDVSGMWGGQNMRVEVANDTSVELRTNFASPAAFVRLATQTDTSLVRALEIWDPARDARVVSGYQGSGDSLILELLTTDGALISGTIGVRCEQPGEVCFNLADDDGDGRIDCADLSCARSIDCVSDQDDLEQVELDCGGDFVALTPPIVGSIDDQRTIYATSPGEDGEAVVHEFWGGAEIAITDVEDDGQITLRFDGEGMVCAGQDLGEVISCPDAVRVVPGEDYTFFTTQLPLWLEPLDASWPGLSARLDCVDDA